MRRRGDEAEDWDGQSRRRPAPYGSQHAPQRRRSGGLGWPIEATAGSIRKSTRRVHLPDAVPVVPLPEWAVGTASGRTLPSAQTPPPENRGAPDCQERSAKTFSLFPKAFRGSQSSFSSALAGVRPPEREPEGEALPPKGIRSAPKAGPRLSGKAVFLCSRERMF